jgi:uncharacterized membrane protein
LVPVVILALATLLRLLFLGEKSFWPDEAFSVRVARLDWTHFWTILTNEQANMALYYTLLRFWLRFGDSEPVIRSLSVIWAVATVPALYVLGSRLFGTRVGLISASLLAMNGYHIRYGQEARSYSLVVFLVTLSSWFFLTSIEQPSQKRWAGYALTSTLAVYSHFFAAYALVAHWASLPFLRRRDIPWKSLVASSVAIVVLLLPLLAFVLTKDAGQIDWIPRPKLSNVPGVFYALAGGAGRLAFAGGVGKLLLLAYFVVSCVTLIVATQTWLSVRASFETWHYGFLLAWLFVPIVLSYVVSLVKPMFLAHYLLVCLPALVLVAAVGLSRIRRQSVFIGAFAVIVVLAAYEVFHYHRDVEGQKDWRGATQFLLSQAESGDAIVFIPRYLSLPFEYYRDRVRGSSRSEALVVLPNSQERVTTYIRVWLVFEEGQRAELETRTHSVQASLVSSHSLVNKTMFTNITVLLYTRTGAETGGRQITLSICRCLF